MARIRIAIVAALLLAVVALGWWWSRRLPMTGGPIDQHAYVWQRQWNDAVNGAVVEHGDAFGRLVLLAAEVSFENGEPRVVHVDYDLATLREAARPIGLAIRINEYRGPFAKDDAVARVLGEVACDHIDRLRAAGIEPAELQVDFDAATADLAGYRLWIEAVREAIGARATPVTITALPSWMRSSAFVPLVQTADGYVLQVHALERPQHADEPMTLIDVQRSRAWVEQAARLGVKFRVALPTYSYELAFDANKRFIGVNAERSVDWPEGTLLRELDADAAELAQLVETWTARRPMMMQGIIWYRMPVRQEVRNWRWATLEDVMAGRTPLAALAAEITERERGLYDIELINAGTADAPLPDRVKVEWGDQAEPLAFDALAGFTWHATQRGRGELRPPDANPPGKLRPGDRITIAWMRFANDTEVTTHVETTEP